MRIAGCRPRAISRSSSSPLLSSRSPSSSSLAVISGCVSTRARATRSLSASETRCCCAPSWRLRSSRRRCSSPASTSRARDAIRSARACALATASETSSQNAAKAALGVVRQRVLARDRDRAPQRAGDDDRRGRRRAIADAEDRVRDLAAVADPAPVVDPRRRAGPQHAAHRGRLLRGEALPHAQDVDVVAVVAADDRRRLVPLVAHDRRRVDLQDPRALLRYRREHALRAHLRGDERGHAAQRALLGGEPRHLGELRVRIALQRPVLHLLGRRAIGQVDAGRDQRGGHAVGAGHRPVGPRDQPPPARLGQPVPDLRARRAGIPDVGEEVAERVALLRRDHDVARVPPEHLVAPEPGRALARVVEEDDAAAAVVARRRATASSRSAPRRTTRRV